MARAQLQFDFPAPAIADTAAVELDDAKCAHCGRGFRRIDPSQAFCASACYATDKANRRAALQKARLAALAESDDAECAHCGRGFRRIASVQSFLFLILLRA